MADASALSRPALALSAIAISPLSGKQSFCAWDSALTQHAVWTFIKLTASETQPGNLAGLGWDYFGAAGAGGGVPPVPVPANAASAAVDNPSTRPSREVTTVSGVLGTVLPGSAAIRL